MGLSPENEFIIRILRSYLEHQNLKLEGGLRRDRVDWNKIISIARAQDLLPLFHHVLSHQKGSEDVSSSERDQIEEGFLAHTASTLLYDSLVKEILFSFQQEAIPFIILKGLSMALEFYHPRETRPYRDLDLLIKIKDFERAKDVLAKLEFRVSHPEREGIRRKYFNSVDFFRPGGAEVHLDLHWETLMVSWNPRPLLSSRDVWKEIRWLECSNMKLPVLQPQMLIVYLCLHLAFHHQFGKLLTLCDLHLVIQKFGKEVDWDEIVRRSRGMMIRKPVYYSLMLAASVLGAQVPKSVLKALAVGKVEGKFFRFYHLVFREKPLHTNVERLAKFFLIDDLRGKIQALIAFYKQR